MCTTLMYNMALEQLFDVIVASAYILTILITKLENAK